MYHCNHVRVGAQNCGCLKEDYPEDGKIRANHTKPDDMQSCWVRCCLCLYPFEDELDKAEVEKFRDQVASAKGRESVSCTYTTLTAQNIISLSETLTLSHTPHTQPKKKQKQKTARCSSCYPVPLSLYILSSILEHVKDSGGVLTLSNTHACAVLCEISILLFVFGFYAIICIALVSIAIAN